MTHLLRFEYEFSLSSAAMSKSLKAVESCTSMADSTTNNNSEAGTPKPTKFYQEDADDASVSQLYYLFKCV